MSPNIVIYHHGKSATGGHYTIDILRQDHSEWLRIDDTQIDLISESDVAITSYEKVTDKDKSAYLLFYQRMPEPNHLAGSSVNEMNGTSSLSSTHSRQPSQLRKSGTLLSHDELSPPKLNNVNA